jgi:replicative DNA helicase
MDRRERGVAVVAGLASGFVDVDERTTGMRDGELIIVAARPGVGKTSYVLAIATNVASGVPETAIDGEQMTPRNGVIVFSLEMSKQQLSDRMLSADARVDLQKWAKGQVTQSDFNAMVESANALAQLPIWIDDTPGLTLLELRSKVRKIQKEFDKPNGAETKTGSQRVGLVVVDYLQLMRGRESAQSREVEVAEISRGLKELAKSLGVPVIALSQLNRAVETRSEKNKRPQLSDLRESGAIENDADVVQFIYRPEMSLTPEEKNREDKKHLRGYAEIIIAKQRNGPTGIVPVTFVDTYTRFENRSRDAWREDD